MRPVGIKLLHRVRVMRVLVNVVEQVASSLSVKGGTMSALALVLSHVSQHHCSPSDGAVALDADRKVCLFVELFEEPGCPRSLTRVEHA